MKNKAFIKKIRSEFPPGSFENTPVRLIWVLFFLVILALSVYSLRLNSMVVSLGAGIAIGYVFAAMAFLFHDLRHGGLIKNKFAIEVLSQFLIWPAFVSSYFWDFWHNQLHHRHHLMENRLLKEYPTETFVKGSILENFIKLVSPPEKGVLAFIYLFFWYVPYIVLIQTLLLFQKDRFKVLNRGRVFLDMVLHTGFWIAWIVLTGYQNMIFTVVIPLFVMSYILSSYVVTNHHPSLVGEPESKILSACSVTVHPVLQKLHLEFGLHTEHHLFPDISPAHLPQVRKMLQEKYANEYCSMNKWDAVKKIYFA